MTKIDNIIHYVNFTKDGRRIPMLEIHYTATKGFAGIVYMEETGATKESIFAAVTKAAAVPDSLIGAELGK
jgi:hypothetical protein